MLVRDLMVMEVATVEPDYSVSKAFQTIVEKKHSQLPVIDKNRKLVGLITEKLLVELSPSKATSLSVFEINYLLSKTKVSEIMKTEVFSIAPGALIEEAAVLMKNNDIGSLPVVESDGTLVGIITRLDVFSAFIEIMGVNDKGTRISLKVVDKLGTIADIAGIIRDFGISISHISDYATIGGFEIVIRLNTLEVDDLLKAFEQNGYEVLMVTYNNSGTGGNVENPSVSSSSDGE